MRQLAVLGLVLLGSLVLVATFVACGYRGWQASAVPGAAGALLGASLLVAAWRLDRHRVEMAARQQRQREREAVDAAARAGERLLADWRAGQVLEVRAAWWRLPLVWLGLVMGACLVFVGRVMSGGDAVMAFGLGGLALVACLWAGVRILPGVGKPALVVSAHGVRVPLYGELPWRDVMGVCTRMGTSRDGRVVSFRVALKLADAGRLVAHPHWTDRLLKAFHRGPLATGIVVTGVCPASADPALVEAVARRLWREATGRDYPWHPGMSDAQMAVMQRQAELMARIEERTAAMQRRADGAASPAAWAAIERDMRELERGTANAFDQSPPP